MNIWKPGTSSGAILNRRRLIAKALAFSLPLMAMLGTMSVAYADWLYDTGTGCMTELNPPGGGTPWVLNCTASGTDLTITSAQQVGDNAVLDLSSSVATSANEPYSIVSVGTEAFNEKGTIEEVRLPNTLRIVGIRSFRNCPALTKVSPFLPDSVTNVGYEAFCNTPVAGTLRVGFGADFAFEKGYYGQAAHFQNTAIGEFEAGPRLTEIPRYAFQNCASLTNVDFTAATGLTTIGFWAFDNCTALRTVTPFLPDTVTTVGVRAFYNTAVEGTLRLGFSVPFTLADDENGWGQGNYFANTKIGKIVFGPGVTEIKRSFAEYSTALTNIVFQTTNLATIGLCAFDGCTSLRIVEPLLPDTVTYVGSLSFRNSVIEGSVRLGFGGALSLPADYYSQAQIFTGAHVDEFVFGPGVTEIPAYFAPGCTSLTNVAFQTTGLTSIGRDAFSGCTSLRTVNPLLPDTVTYIGTMAFYNTVVEGALRLGFCDGTVTLPAEHYGQAHQFTASRISEIVFGSGITSVPAYFAERCSMLTNIVFQGSNTVAVGAAAFNNCSALREIEAHSYVSWSSDTFWQTGQDLNGRILYPMTNREWNDYINSLGGDFKTWSDDATAAEKELYQTLFPDGTTPRGHAAAGGPKRWFVPYTEFIAGAVNLNIIGEPYDLGVAVPDYSGLTAVTPPAALSVSQYGELDGIAYESVGYRVDTIDGETFAIGTPVYGTRSFTFNEDEADFYRIAWLWREAAYSLTAASVGPCAVSVSGTTLSDPSVAGTYYLSNTVATVTATPSAGATFVRWFGDVPEAQTTSTTITLPMDSVRHVTPYVALPWTYDATTQTVTDGYWTLNVTGSSDALTIASVKTAPDTIWLLDLRKATDGCVFAKIGTDAFKEKTYLQEVRLPDTITSIGRGAFDSCTELRRVSPFLPNSVTEVGVEAFRNSPVEGTLRIGFGGPFTMLLDDRGWNGSEYFRNTQVGEIVFGPGVTEIRRLFAADCKALTNVVFQTTALETIATEAFFGCTALRRVEPFLPDTVTYVGAAAFHSAPVEGTLRLGFGKPVGLGSEFYGQGRQFWGTGVERIITGRGVTNITSFFARECLSLKRVDLDGKNLKHIEYSAFEYDSELEEVRIRAFPSFGSTVFNGVPDKARFFLANESAEWDDWLANPANATPWENLATSVQDAYDADWGANTKRPVGRVVGSHDPFPQNRWLLRYTATTPTLFIMQ